MLWLLHECNLLSLSSSLPLFLVLILGKTGPWWWFQLLSASDRWLLLIYDLWCMCRKASSSLCMSLAMSFPFKVAEPISSALGVLFFSVLKMIVRKTAFWLFRIRWINEGVRPSYLFAYCSLLISWCVLHRRLALHWHHHYFSVESLMNWPSVRCAPCRLSTLKQFSLIIMIFQDLRCYPRSCSLNLPGTVWVSCAGEGCEEYSPLLSHTLNTYSRFFYFRKFPQPVFLSFYLLFPFWEH